MQHIQLSTLLPLAIAVLILFALAKWTAPAWALVLTLALGITLTVIYGPAAHQILSQFSGGLH
jgi:hypothetical protein